MDILIESFKVKHPNMTRDEICDVVCRAACILNRKRKIKWRQVKWDDIEYIMEKWDDFIK